MHLNTRRMPAALLVGAVTALLVFASAGAVPAGAAWARAGTLPDLGAGRIWSLASSPVTAGMVVAGTDRGVYVSSDSGGHWAASGLTGVRVWSVGFDPRDATRIFVGTDGSGVELSTDAGATWTVTSQGLPDKTVRTLAIGLDGLAAGTNHGVALSADGKTWHDGGLGGYSINTLVIAANSPNLVLVAGTDRGDTSNGYLFRLDTAGRSWQALQSGLPASAVVTSLAAGPLSSSVTKRPVVATTSKGTFRSGDSGSTWTASTGIPENLTLTTAVFSPLDPSLVYAGADVGGSNGGDLLRSTDGGGSFGVAGQGLPDKMRQVESIAVEQTTPPVVIAALDPAAGGIVYSETDATAPAPPALVSEAPGAPIPSTLATPVASAAPSSAPTPAPAPAAEGLVSRFVGTVFHWPMPLVLEILLVLTVAYLVVRWRQRYYVEGPP
jgi:hypothetical protein